jgi:flagellar FliL protein
MAAAAKKEKKKKKGEEAPEPANDTDGAPAANGEAGAEGEGEGKAKKKMSGKTLVLFVILPALLILGGGGAAAFMLLGHGGGASHAEQHAEAGKEKGKGEGPGESTPGPNGTTIIHGENVVFVTLPEMLVNITRPDGSPGYLKLKLTLEAPNDEVVTTLTSSVPRISDEYNGFLRELRTDDLVGSAGAYRLRLELLRRVNLVIAPAQINAVLIEEMLVQ